MEKKRFEKGDYIMGLFSWLFGGDKSKEHVKMGSGMHQVQPASMSAMQAGSGTHMQHAASASGMSGMKMAKDPVCGMDVSPEKAAATSAYQGTTYYFCAPGCKKTFDENPTKYLGGSGQMKEGMHGGKHGGGCC